MRRRCLVSMAILLALYGLNRFCLVPRTGSRLLAWHGADALAGGVDAVSAGAFAGALRPPAPPAGPGMGVSSGLRSLLGVCDAPLSAPVGVGPPGHSGGVAGRHHDAGPSAPPPMDTPARKQIASAHCTLWLPYSRRRFFHFLSSGLTDFPAAAPDFPASATHTWHRHPDRPGRYCGRSGRAPFSPRRPLRCCPPPDDWKTRYTTP